MAADTQDTKPVAETAAETVTKEAPKAKAKAPAKVRLTIHKDSNPNAVDPVFVGVNFVGYTIKRGEEVVVPKEVADALESAVENRYEQKGSEMTLREVPSYSCSSKPL